MTVARPHLRSTLRTLAVLTSSALVLSAGAGAVHAGEMVERTSGGDRIATAVAASRDHRPSAVNAVLATADSYPDALAAGALANRLDAPVLLTGSDALPAPVADELARLGVREVWLLGGPSAIASAVADDLAGRGYEVHRIQGADRYATAGNIARAAGPARTNEVVVALGEHPQPERAWPDAVASSALAATPDHVPTLLTQPETLPTATRDALADLDTRRVILLGGDASISGGVESALRDAGYEVERMAGASRYETSILLAADALARDGDPSQPVVFASGQDFPDALSAGALAAQLQAPLVLVPSRDLADSVDAFLRERVEQWTGGVLIGGTAAADPRVQQQLEAAITGQPAPAPVAEQPAPAAEEPEPRVVGTFDGEASWYGPGFAGRPTASGERFNPNDLTAAHRTLPFGTNVRVTNAANGAQVTVRINDRGPFHARRVLDVSSAAADRLGMKASGTVWVHGEILEG